jgi:hypothetical protein
VFAGAGRLKDDERTKTNLVNNTLYYAPESPSAVPRLLI